MTSDKLCEENQKVESAVRYFFQKAHEAGKEITKKNIS